MKLQLPKGTRDFPPREMILREELIATLKEIFSRYGYNPLETPSFERFDVLAGKYAGGAEILKEAFRFTDQGDRELGLRYDLTVPFARFVGMNPHLKLPFKRYAIGSVFRDGPIKLGRYREFSQCDVDVVGSKSVLADAECIRIAEKVFKELGIAAEISVNNRKLLEELLIKGGVPSKRMGEAMLVLDKIKKLGITQVKKELVQKGIPEKSVEPVVRFSQGQETNTQRISALGKFLGKTEGFLEVQELFSALKGVGNVRLDPSLARGLAYYTGTVFEGFAIKGKVSASICGGGRYDLLIGELLGNGREYPTVGISFGLEPIMDLLQETAPKSATRVKIFVVPIKNARDCIPIIEQLRSEGIRADMDYMGRGISKCLEYANSYNIPYVLIAGSQELDAGKVKLRDMKSGKEELLTPAAAVRRLQHN